MLIAVNLTQLSYGFVHQILPSDIVRAWKMVNFLVFFQALVDLVFDGTDIPYDTRLLLE